MPQPGRIDWQFYLDPVDFKTSQFYIDTSSQSLQTHSEISKQIGYLVTKPWYSPYIGLYHEYTSKRVSTFENS